MENEGNMDRKEHGKKMDATIDGSWVEKSWLTFPQILKS